MKRIYVIEDLCNGCRLCETFCSSLTDGVFGVKQSRIKVIKPPGEEKDIPIVNCDGRCVRPLYDDGRPTCVAVCPTGALIYEERNDAVARRLELEAAREEHSLFKVIAPWKWPFPWRSHGAHRPPLSSPPHAEGGGEGGGGD
jgi:Fe-S-cluster-containing dehydrogenase component